MSERRWLTAGVGAAAVLLFVPLFVPMTRGRMFVAPDLAWFHIPVRYLYGRALAEGDSILWTPAFFRGFFLHGEGQLGALHPLHLLLYRTLPLAYGLGVELVIVFAAAVAGMALFLRRLGLSGAAALFGGLLFAFGGYNVSNLQRLNLVGVASHLPWIALGVHGLMLGDLRWRPWAFATLALSVGSALLLGYPQVLAMGLMFAAAFAIGVAAVTRRWRLLAAPLLAVAAGAAIGGAQILPTLQVMSRSERALVSLSFIGSFSLHPWNLLQLLSPYALRLRVYASPEELQIHEFSIYDGAFCTLAVCWIAARASSVGRRLALGSLAVAAAALVLALGRYVGVHVLLAAVPILDRFRGPARFIIIIHFAMAIAGALTLDDIRRLARDPGSGRVPYRILAGVAIAAGAAAAVAIAVFGHAAVWERAASASRIAFGLGLMVGCAGLVAAAARGRRWALAALPLFAAADLAWWGYRAVMTRPMTPAELADSVLWAIPPEAGPGSVLYSPPDASVNVVTIADRWLTQAYTGMIVGRILPADDAVAMRLSGVHWRHDQTGWHRIAETMPTVRVVTDVRQTTDLLADLRRVDISRTAFAAGALPTLSGPPGTARLLRHGAGRIDVEVDGAGEALLVTTESWDADWRASDGSTPLRVVRVNGDYLGALVPPGRRMVTFRFHSVSTRRGLMVSAAGLLLTGVAVFAMRRASAGER